MEISSVVTSLVALLFVLSLIGLVSVLLKKYGESGLRGMSEGKKKRLKVKEVLVIDGKRKLVLIERDGEKEHLLLCAPEQNLVVEQDIPVSEPEET